MKLSTRIITWVVTAPIVVIVVLFAVSNRDDISLRLLPFPFDLTMPIWLWTLVELFVGFLLGAIVTWIGDRRRRRQARLLSRRVSELEQSLATARKQAADLEHKLGELRGPPPMPAAGAA
jgi:uncharacterized integral membrane protein